MGSGRAAGVESLQEFSRRRSLHAKGGLQEAQRCLARDAQLPSPLQQINPRALPNSEDLAPLDAQSLAAA